MVIVSVMWKGLGLTMIVAVLVLGLGPPIFERSHQAQAMFHDHVENAVNELFKPKPDPIFINPTNQGHVAINDLHSKYPNIVQNDINIAHQAVTIACIQSVNDPGNPFVAGLCSNSSHNILAKYLNNWGYEYLIGTSTTMPPQLVVK